MEFNYTLGKGMVFFVKGEVLKLCLTSCVLFSIFFSSTVVVRYLA